MSGFFQPSAQTHDALRAAVLALKIMPRQLRNDLNKEVRQLGNALWRPIVESNAQTEQDRLILAKGARVKPGNPLVLSAASSKRPLSGGLIPNEDAGAFEFGPAMREKTTTYDRRNARSSGTHAVTRRTRRQLPRRSKGRVVYESAAEIMPRITSMWVQTIVRAIYNAHEGKN